MVWAGFEKRVGTIREPPDLLRGSARYASQNLGDARCFTATSTCPDDRARALDRQARRGVRRRHLRQSACPTLPRQRTQTTGGTPQDRPERGTRPAARWLRLYPWPDILPNPTQLGSNVEVTGAARPYRAAPVDRRVMPHSALTFEIATQPDLFAHSPDTIRTLRHMSMFPIFADSPVSSIGVPATAIQTCALGSCAASRLGLLTTSVAPPLELRRTYALSRAAESPP